MGWDAVVKSGVKLADSITQTLQPYVTYSAWIGQDVFGNPRYTAAVRHRALVDTTVRKRRLPSGQEVSVRARVSFFRPMPSTVAPTVFTPAFAPTAFAHSAFATGAAIEINRVNPIDPRDLIILPDGTTGPIVDSEGLVNPSTNRPYFSELWVGV